MNGIPDDQPKNDRRPISPGCLSGVNQWFSQAAAEIATEYGLCVMDVLYSQSKLPGAIPARLRLLYRVCNELHSMVKRGTIHLVRIPPGEFIPPGYGPLSVRLAARITGYHRNCIRDAYLEGVQIAEALDREKARQRRKMQQRA